MNPDILLPIAIGAVINGAVTFGVIKATLHFLEEGIKDAKANATRAHKRIDSILSGHNHGA